MQGYVEAVLSDKEKSLGFRKYIVYNTLAFLGHQIIKSNRFQERP